MSLSLTLDVPELIEEHGVDAVREIEGRAAETLRVLVAPSGAFVAVATPVAADLAPGHILHVEGRDSLRIEARVARNAAAAIFSCRPLEEDSEDAADKESA